jgi:hypothetical protein
MITHTEISPGRERGGGGRVGLRLDGSRKQKAAPAKQARQRIAIDRQLIFIPVRPRFFCHPALHSHPPNASFFLVFIFVYKDRIHKFAIYVLLL